MTHFDPARNLFPESPSKKRFDQSFSFERSFFFFFLSLSFPREIARKIGATSVRESTRGGNLGHNSNSIVAIVSRYEIFQLPFSLYKTPWRIPARFAGLRIRGYDDLSNVELRHKLGSCACHVPLL